MIDHIIKRDGSRADFDRRRIYKAIEAADREVGPLLMADGVDSVTDAVVADLSLLPEPTVEACQDIVERHLSTVCPEVAKAYIIYRHEHAKMRQDGGKLLATFADLIQRSAKDADTKRENANIDADTAMGTMLKVGSEASKWFVDSSVIPKDISLAHQCGDIHIHDKDFYMLTETCCQIDLRRLFSKGFSTGHGFLRKPNSIESYAALACIAIQANQNEMHGGQSIPAFDFYMADGVLKTWSKEFSRALSDTLELSGTSVATEYLLPHALELTGRDRDAVLAFLVDPRGLSFADEKEGIPASDLLRHARWAFVKADEMTEKRTHQAMESFIHNLNTMASRAGAQVPFSSVNYGTDTSWAGRLVMRELLRATREGLGQGETAIFPVQIFKVKEGVNYDPGDPNHDLFLDAIRTSAARLFPNFEFLDAPFNLQYYRPGDVDSEVATMGCRTRVMGNVNGEETTPGRGNLSFTSLNLPRLGIEAAKSGDPEGKFFRLLDERLDLVFRQLLHRFKIQAHKKVRNYPFLMGNAVWRGAEDLDWDDEIGEVLKHGTLSVGFIGLAECLVALTGKHHGESEKAQELGLRIIGHMRERCDLMTKERGLNFTLIGTPAEGLSGRFTKLDRERYGVIPGVTDREYYTNSSHVPVHFPLTAHRKIEIEAPYHALCNAGHICYVELDGDTAKNPRAFERIIRHMHDMGVGYGSVNHPLDRDPVCGYIGVIGDVCPRCGRREGEGVSPERLREIRQKYPHALNSRQLVDEGGE